MEDSNVSKCDTALKYLVYCAISLTVTCGIILVALSFWILITEDDYSMLYDGSMLTYALYAVIVVGVVSILVATWWICLLLRKKPNKSVVVFALMTALAVILFLIGIVIFVHRVNLMDETTIVLRKSMSKYDNDTIVKEQWDDVQIKFNCCGTTLPANWISVRNDFPESCYNQCPPDDDGKCVREKIACLSPLVRVLRSNSLTLGAPAISFSMIFCLNAIILFFESLW